MEVQQTTTPPRCAICGTTEQLLRCAKCKTAYYCSTSHQHMDWPTHKHHCRVLARQKRDNARIQQMRQAISATGSLSNGIPQMPTTTYPLATAVTYGQELPDQQQQQQLQQQQQQLSMSNDKDFSMLTENFIDNSSDGAGALTNANLNANSPTVSVIYGANENEIPNEPEDENILVDPITMAAMQQFFLDAANNAASQDSRQVLSTLVEQYQQPSTTMNQQTYAQFRNQNNQHEKSSSYQIGQGDENVMANFNERRYEELCRNITNDMNQYGLSVVDDFLGMEKGMEILREVHNMYCAGVFQDGQLVNNRRTEQDLNRSIRGDKITWVKGVEPGCTSVGYLINQIDAVICRANTMHNNGKLGNYNIKERTKAMVACYPGSGAHYVTHVDNPNKDGRVITAIYYLNVDWDSKRSGGVLRIFPESSPTVADIEPKFDRLIFFWSDKRNPHEVQPSHRTRYAITVWYFDAHEREAALNRCKFGNVPKAAPDSSKSMGRHLPPEFSKANENSNPNLNTNFNSNSSQPSIHQNEICT